MSEDDECAFCDEPATGVASVIEAETGERLALSLCARCGEHFKAPPGTMVEMPPYMPGADQKLLN